MKPARLALALSSTTLVLAMITPADAGAAWENEPQKGPSPNNSHEVSGEGCPAVSRVEPSGFGSSVLGGIQPLGVNVTLRDPSDTDTLKTEHFDIEDQSTGSWGGTFEIPEGLAPGVYPLKARCLGIATERAGIGSVVLGGENPGEFDYPDLSYTVVSWTNSPIQGASPNAGHQVSGNGCSTDIQGDRQGLSLGGLINTLEVEVTLYGTNGTTELASRTFEANESGDWAGTFPIPGGLDPATYPLGAECLGIGLFRSGLGVASGVSGQIVDECIDCFVYDRRSYRVIGSADPADPVEADVTFTG